MFETRIDWSLFRITMSGMMALLTAVLTLWTCIALEQMALHQAAKDVRTSMQILKNLRRQTAPAAQPIRIFARAAPSRS